MPRKFQEISPVDPYHINARSNNRESFYLPIEEVWEIMSNYLHFISHAFNCKIHNFVLMPNHFHMICQFPEANLGDVMNYFMRETSKAIARQAGRINHVYGGPARPTLIKDANYYANAYKYVYRNPVKANLCSRVEDYRFSTLHGKLGFEHLLIPVVEDVLLFDGKIEDTLTWLNTPSIPENEEAVRRALKKAVFKLAKDPHSRKPHVLEAQRL